MGGVLLTSPSIEPRRVSPVKSGAKSVSFWQIVQGGHAGWPTELSLLPENGRFAPFLAVHAQPPASYAIRAPRFEPIDVLGGSFDHFKSHMPGLRKERCGDRAI